MMPCICCKSVHTSTHMKNLTMSHSPILTICAGPVFEVAVFVVGVHVGLVVAADVKTVQEVVVLAAPIRSPGLEGGVLAGTCKIACCLEEWAAAWGWARAWDMAWGTEA